MGWFVVVFAVLVTVSVGVFALRFPLRHVARGLRASRTGDFHWFELINEEGESGPGSRKANLAGVRTLAETIKSSFPFLSRKVASIIWSNDDDGVLHLYVGVTSFEEADVEGGVRSLAKSIGCTVKPLNGTPDIPTGGLMTAVRDRIAAITVDKEPSVDGSVVAGIADQLEKLEKGERAAFIVTMESMRPGEAKRLESEIVRYSHERSGDDASQMRGMDDSARLMTTDAVRASIGATNSRGDEGLSERILRAGTSGIDTLGYSLNYKSPHKSHSRSAVVVSSLGIVMTVISVLLGVPVAVGLLLGILQVGVVVGNVMNLGFFGDKWFDEASARGEIVVPSYMMTSPRYWILSRDDRFVRYALPSPRQVISLYPSPLYEIVRFPSADSETNVARANTNSRGLPKGMLEVENGIYMGLDGFRQPILLDLEDLSYSMYTAGAPNSGKTNFLQTIYAGCVRHSMDRTNGMSIAPIWGETKGDGAYDAWEMAKHHPDAKFLDVHNPKARGRAGYRFALEGRRISEGATIKEVNDNSAALVNALQYAYGDGIRAASKEVLRASIGLSMLLSEEHIRFLELDGVVDPEAPNIIDLSFYLLGGDTRLNPTEKLLNMQQEADTGEERDFYIDYFIGILSRTLTQKTNAAALSSSLNKLSDLREAPLTWEPSKHKKSIYVADIVNSGAPTVINMGAYRLPDSDGYAPSISDTVSQKLTRISLRLLWSHIKANCSGWQAQGKRIPLFFDEVADIASGGQNDDTENVVEQAMKEGRSRGLAMFLGCQSPSQMPMSVRMQVLGARTKFWFNLHNPEDLKMAVDDLASGSDKLPYNQQTLREFSNGSCAGIMRRGSGTNDTVTPPFTLMVPRATTWSDALFANDDINDALAEYEEQAERSLRR